MKIIAEFNSVRFPSNKAGTTANLSYSSNPRSFTAICNKLEQFPVYFDMIHFVDLGAALQPSTLNMGWYRLSDDVDIKISSTIYGWQYGFFSNCAWWWRQWEAIWRIEASLLLQ